MSVKFFGALAVLGVLSLSGGAVAAAAAEDGSPMTIIPKFDKLEAETRSPEGLFAALDADGDGQVSRAEWRNRKMAIFYMRDADDNMHLDRGELPGLAASLFAAADRNGDGVVSGYEFNQAAFTQFDKADVDEDGAVSPDAFRRFTETLDGAP